MKIVAYIIAFLALAAAYGAVSAGADPYSILSYWPVAIVLLAGFLPYVFMHAATQLNKSISSATTWLQSSFENLGKSCRDFADNRVQYLRLNEGGRFTFGTYWAISFAMLLTGIGLIVCEGYLLSDFVAGNSLADSPMIQFSNLINMDVAVSPELMYSGAVILLTIAESLNLLARQRFPDDVPVSYTASNAMHGHLMAAATALTLLTIGAFSMHILTYSQFDDELAGSSFESSEITSIDSALAILEDPSTEFDIAESQLDTEESKAFYWGLNSLRLATVLGFVSCFSRGMFSILESPVIFSHLLSFLAVCGRWIVRMVGGVLTALSEFALIVTLTTIRATLLITAPLARAMHPVTDDVDRFLDDFGGYGRRDNRVQEPEQDAPSNSDTEVPDAAPHVDVPDQDSSGRDNWTPFN